MQSKANAKRNSSALRTIAGIFAEVALTGLLLFVFALPHHVIPRLTERNREVVPIAVMRPAQTETHPAAPAYEPVPPAPNVSSANPDPVSVSEPDGVNPVASADHSEPEPEPEPDPYAGLTEWQIKFRDKFTDEIVITDNSYTSPEISVTLEKFTTDEKKPVTYYVADIYVASLENFQTHLAGGSFRKYASEDPVAASIATGGIVTINGDYCDNYYGGFVVRNGQVYYAEQTTMDVCVMYYDGTVKTFAPDEYRVEDILADNPYQVWYFGPGLLDENGDLKETYNTGNWVGVANPRSAFGYYEPGHYCFVLVDGRQEGYSRGFDIYELAQLFKDLGCTEAYNMDGGASAVMTFQHRVANRPCFGARDSGDILLICERPTETETEESKVSGQ